MDEKEQLQKNEPQNNEETLTREPNENFDNDKVENNEDIESKEDLKTADEKPQSGSQETNEINQSYVKNEKVYLDSANESENKIHQDELSLENEYLIKRKKMDKGLKIFLWIMGTIAVLAMLFVFSALTASYIKNKNFDIFGQFNSSQNGDAPTLDLVDKTETEGTMTAEAIYKKVAPSIVGIITYNPGQGLLSSGVAQGSGIVMKSDGYILTNAHVVGNSNKLNVTVVIDKKEYSAKVVGFDTRTDLAVLKIDAQNLTAAQFGNSDELNVGEWVLAIGNPGGIEFSNSLTRGIVSALNRSLGSENNPVKYIQTDAAINPGNSGGALVNMYGQIIGINTAKKMDYEALGFAIPINTAKTIVDDIIKNGYVSGRVKIGVTVRPISAYEAQAENVPQGVLIMEISKDSSLYQQNIQSGDIITKIDDTSVKTTTDLYGELSKHSPGDVVNLTIFRLSPLKREGSTFDVKVTLIEDKG